MRTETEMLDVILKTAETLQVATVAMSGSRTDTKASKDEFQDYDVVYVVENLDELITDLSWFGPVWQTHLSSKKFGLWSTTSIPHAL